MCGIFVSLGVSCPTYPSDDILARLKKRGPDSLQQISRVIEPEKGRGQSSRYLTAVSSVLSMRGKGLIAQPVTDRIGLSSSFLSWNGEAWKFDSERLGIQDTDFIYRRLCATIEVSLDRQRSESDSPAPVIQAVLNTLSKISGPYAFVFYDSVNRLIFYGRDALGRRSLLIRWLSSHAIEISSVSGEPVNDGWAEIDAGGIYVLDLASGTTSDDAHSHSKGETLSPPLLIPWQFAEQLGTSPYLLRSPLPYLNKNLGRDGRTIDSPSPGTAHLYDRLKTSLDLRLAFTYVSDHCQEISVAILFSGGLDCTIIARLANDIFPEGNEIDLLNVAFENPRVIKAAARGTDVNQITISPYELCPDRITGRKSYAELVRVCPTRKWRFVSIDIPYAETRVHRSEIMALLHPHRTEMDFSIGCALYFAARGQGRTTDPMIGAEVPYTTPARVLLSGLGADELFGGYTRHAIAFNRRGHIGLVEELNLDFERLGKRNLGRDDRIISHWGKEVRYPFLDEDLVSWALSAPVWEKCSFGEDIDSQSKIEPSKSVLRHLAWELGLKGAAVEKKRAIQFGARTAKMESGNSRGNQILE